MPSQANQPVGARKMSVERPSITEHPLVIGIDDNYPDGAEFIIELATKPCPYACSFCAIRTPNNGRAWANTLSREIDKQVEFALSLFDLMRSSKFFRINLSAAGSVLDDNSVDYASLLRTVRMIGEKTRVPWLNFETRADLLTPERYHTLCMVAADVGMRVMPGIGYETRSASIRNDILKKQIDDRSFNEALRIVADGHKALKPLCMLKPWEAPDEIWQKEAIDTIEFFAEAQSRYGIKMEVHVAPTYVAAGTKLYADFIAKRYKVISEISLLESLLSFQPYGVQIWITHHSEERAVKDGEPVANATYPNLLRFAIDEFNRLNDYDILYSYLDLVRS